MTFLRTPNGIGNQALFLGKRFIVYVEEEANLDPARSIDVPFWNSFFRTHYPDLSFEFKALGGKAHVLNVAREIVAHSIPNSLCALDKDYDDLFGVRLDDERIFYTFGYGTENDATNENTVQRVVSTLLPGRTDRADLGTVAWDLVMMTMRRERLALISDQLAACRLASTLDRDKPASAIDLERETLPLRFRRREIKRKVAVSRGLPIARLPTTSLDVSWYNAPAHLFFEVVYHTLYRYVRAYTGVKFSKDWIRSLAVVQFDTAFIDSLSGGAKAHYQALGQRDVAKFAS